RYSYASRQGKGTHAALDRCTQMARRFPYVLRCDIVQFFPSMDHAVLRAQLARVIGDPDVLWLCDLILAGGVGPLPPAPSPAWGGGAGDEPLPPAPSPLRWGGGAGDEPLPPAPSPAWGGGAGSGPSRPASASGSPLPRTGEGLGVGAATGSPPLVGEGLGERSRGLPIGNQTSQFWANVYLDSLDQFVMRELRCPGYVRYVDDFLLFAPDKPALHAWRRAVIAFLATLRLSLHEPEAAVSPVATGIPFLGFRVYPDHRRLRRRNGVAFARRFRALAAEVAAGTVPVERLSAAVRGWVAHAAHADTYRLRASLLRRVPLPVPVTLTSRREVAHAAR
ncbi:MAG TPA: hypothetical protein VIG30_00810, partial [Ktedonobacterales bacterium]